MSTDHVTFDNPGWGSPEPAPRGWGRRETAVAVGIAAVIAGLGGAAIYAATGQSSPAIGPPGHQAFGPTHGGAAGPGGPGGVVPAGPHGLPLHGQFVVAGDSGGYTTVLTQTGTVTESSASSVTVRSEDGFSQTYLLSPDQAASTPAVHDTVMVRAVAQGDTATSAGSSAPPTATEVIDPR
ncbi:hypothetical protein [Mycolicibacterium sp. CR10]|uniref:hypothetical protein n=1 Tax=Mycolicibacterium sp. CR10 TaxID=2562314 RepID=UPI001F1120FB|nr:hypothetical protein [Mycolicibacterium sp. CR10]